MYEESSNYLKHYGVLGMRWGRRSFGMQAALANKPKRTPLSTKQLGGVKGALNSVDSFTSGGKRLTNIAEKMTNKKTDLSKMSDEDLRKQVARMNLEQSYRSLSSVDKSRGAETVRNILETVGAVVTVGSSAIAIVMGIKALKEGSG